MPAFDAYDAIFTSLEADVLAVWPDTVRVFRGTPRLNQTKWPYVVIWLNPEQPIGQVPESVQGCYQTPDIRITRVAKLPADKAASVLDTQISEANAIIERLERNSYYQTQSGANLAMWPWAKVAELPIPGDDEQTYEVNVALELTIRVLHTSKQS
jgi:hypothetical protein